MNKYLRGIVKKFIVPKLKFACIVRLVIDQRLVVVHQLFIWTAVRPSICRQNHRFARQSDSLSSSLSATYIIKRLFQNQFFRNDWTSKPNIEKKKIIVLSKKLVWFFSNCFITRGYQAFTNCSVGFQSYSREVRLTKWWERNICPANKWYVIICRNILSSFFAYK